MENLEKVKEKERYTTMQQNEMTQKQERLEEESRALLQEPETKKKCWFWPFRLKTAQIEKSAPSEIGERETRGQLCMQKWKRFFGFFSSTERRVRPVLRKLKVMGFARINEERLMEILRHPATEEYQQLEGIWADIQKTSYYNQIKQLMIMDIRNQCKEKGIPLYYLGKPLSQCDIKGLQSIHLQLMQLDNLEAFKEKLADFEEKNKDNKTIRNKNFETVVNEIKEDPLYKEKLAKKHYQVVINEEKREIKEPLFRSYVSFGNYPAVSLFKAEELRTMLKNLAAGSTVDSQEKNITGLNQLFEVLQVQCEYWKTKYGKSLENMSNIEACCHATEIMYDFGNLQIDQCLMEVCADSEMFHIPSEIKETIAYYNLMASKIQARIAMTLQALLYSETLDLLAIIQEDIGKSIEGVLEDEEKKGTIEREKIDQLREQLTDTCNWEAVPVRAKKSSK